MKKQLLTILCAFLGLYFIQAQKPGEQIFNNDIVHEVRLEFEQSNFWTQLTQNYERTRPGEKVPYILGNVTIDGELVDSIGVRLKGFTSYTRTSDKKPIKLDFNEYVKAKRFDGLRKLNLNNGTADPAMQRDIICYDLLRNSGVSVPRTSFSKVYINGKYWGLYQNIEQVDKTFINENFANSGGNLFKNKGWNNFEWKGPSTDSLHPPYELKTNKTKADWSGLLNFVDVLNNTPDDKFQEEFEKIFNVDLYLKTLAVDVATKNWDSNLQHGRNWYMYEDTITGIFHWIPWDYNLALGGTLGFGGPQDSCTIFPGFGFETNGTPTVIFNDQSFIVGNPTYEWTFGDGNSSMEQNPTHTYAAVGNYRVCMRVSTSNTCSQRICKIVDTSFDPAECPSIKNGSCPHPVNAAFKQIIQWIPACCDDWTQNCEDIYVQISGSGNGDITIDQRETDRTLIRRLLNVEEYNDKYYGYFCELLNSNMTQDRLFKILDNNHDLITKGIEADPNFLFNHKDFQDDIGANGDTLGLKTILNTLIEDLKLDLDSLYNCPDNGIIIPWHDIVINEFVASNDSTSGISDPNGQFEDWIEIYNNTNVEIDLSETYLSDKISDLKQWQFPDDTKIEANGYLIVWADKDEDEEGIHSSFKLSKSGEQLVLSNNDGSIIDSLSFGEQSVNIAAARRPNGTGNFVFQTTTFGGNNNHLSNIQLSNQLAVSIYPNPTSGMLNIIVHNKQSQNYNVCILSPTGQLLSNYTYADSSIKMDLQHLNNGLFIVQITDDKGNVARHKIMMTN